MVLLPVGFISEGLSFKNSSIASFDIYWVFLLDRVFLNTILNNAIDWFITCSWFYFRIVILTFVIEVGFSPIVGRCGWEPQGLPGCINQRELLGLRSKLESAVVAAN